MTYARFVTLDFLGGFIWIFSLCWLGYGFGNMPVVKKNLVGGDPRHHRHLAAAGVHRLAQGSSRPGGGLRLHP